MAARRNSRKKNDDANVETPDNSTETELHEMTEPTTFEDTEINPSDDSIHNEQENGEIEMTEQSPEEIVEPTPDNSEENVNPPAASDEEVSEGDNSQTDSGTSEENSAPETPKFDLPKNPTDLTLSDPMLTIIGQRALVVKQSIDSLDNLLKVQAEGDSSGVILEYAESSEASANVKQLFSEYDHISKQLDEILSQLTSAVKEEKGEVILTAEQIQEKKDERGTYFKNFKTAVQFIEDYIRDNPETGEDGKNFLETIRTSIGGRGVRTTSAAGGTGTYQASTNIRPRLGDDGYIQIGDAKVKTFTDAVKVLRKKTSKPISAGEIHTAWASAAGFGTTDNWANCPQGDSHFTIGGDDENPGEPVTIHFAKQQVTT